MLPPQRVGDEQPEQIPTTDAERFEWLYAWRERIDGWIAAQQ